MFIWKNERKVYIEDKYGLNKMRVRELKRVLEEEDIPEDANVTWTFHRKKLFMAEEAHIELKFQW